MLPHICLHKSCSSLCVAAIKSVNDNVVFVVGSVVNAVVVVVAAVVFYLVFGSLALYYCWLGAFARYTATYMSSCPIAHCNYDNCDMDCKCSFLMNREFNAFS